MTSLFETDRLVVRQLRPDDIDRLFAITGDAELMRYMGDGQPLSRELTAKWIEVSINNYATKGFGCSAVIDTRDGAFIGFCGLVQSEDAEPPEASELIYALLRSYWGQGLATELAAEMVAYGWRACGLKRIIATIYPKNLGSKRILEKIGMTYLKHELDEDGSPTDFYGINAS